ELLEFEPGAGARQLRVILREMDRPEGYAAVAEPSAAHDPSGQHVGDARAAFLEQPVQDLAERAAVEAYAAQLRAARIQGDDAARFERGALPIQLVEIRMRHAERPAVKLGF